MATTTASWPVTASLIEAGSAAGHGQLLPAHRRRRWCSPATCGNRARVARYYQLHKEDKTPEPLTADRDCIAE